MAHAEAFSLATKILFQEQEATRNKCIASSNKCLTSSNKKLLGTILFQFSSLRLFVLCRVGQDVRPLPVRAQRVWW